MVKVGETVQVNMSIAANVPDSHSFTLGSTIRHISSERDFDLPLDSTTLRGSDTGNGTFFWIVPNDAPTGPSSIIAAIWEGVTNGLPFNILDDSVLANAFSIE